MIVLLFVFGKNFAEICRECNLVIYKLESNNFTLSVSEHATTRAVLAAHHSPNWGGPRGHRGAQNSCPSPLSGPEKASIPQIEI